MRGRSAWLVVVGSEDEGDSWCSSIAQLALKWCCHYWLLDETRHWVNCQAVWGEEEKRDREPRFMWPKTWKGGQSIKEAERAQNESTYVSIASSLL
jgi:hypothetical protein